MHLRYYANDLGMGVAAGNLPIPESGLPTGEQILGYPVPESLVAIIGGAPVGGHNQDPRQMGRLKSVLSKEIKQPAYHWQHSRRMKVTLFL